MRILIFLSLFLIIECTASNDAENLVTYLEPGGRILVRETTYLTDLKIYCYAGRPKYLIHLFHTVQLQIDIEDDNYMLYEGSTPEMVSSDYDDKRSLFSFNFFMNRKKNVNFNPFNQTCLGIDTATRYAIHLHLIHIDFYKVIYLALGLVIFFSAVKLSENALFYYLVGIFLGIFASFLVIIYLSSKLIPKKPMMYGFMVGGWTLGLYFTQMLWENFRMILVTYQVYVFWYVVVTGLISFVVCYRFGPPKNKRSKNLIKWGLQLAGLILIFCSSKFQEASASICIIALIVYYFPKKLIYQSRGLWLRRFPPKPRLLTSEEYYEQGVRETTKALEELRNYCSSPDCKQWSTVMRLKHPKRFASFMEGSSHILDEEILEYEVSVEELIRNEEEDDENNDSERNLNISEDEDVYNSNRNNSRKISRSQFNSSNAFNSNGGYYSNINSTPNNSKSMNNSRNFVRNRGVPHQYDRNEFSDED